MTSKTKKRSKKVDKNKLLIKTVSLFFVYFLYSYIVNLLFNNSIISSFIADILFMLGIMYVYKDNLKEDVKNLKRKYNLKKIIITIISWVVLILISNIIMGALTDFIAPNMGKTLDDNSMAINNLFSISSYYTIFKTMVFSVIAEELLFRESIHDVVENKWLFIFFSATIYTLINFVFTGFATSYIYIRILSYFLPGLILSTAYYKNNCNIIILMLIKFTYQLIPLTLMFISA